MNLDATEKSDGQKIRPELSGRLKILAVVGTIFGIGLFAVFVYSAGVGQIAESVSRFGLFGFAVILGIFFLRICLRASAWALSVYEPYSLRLRDTVPAVIIGEVMSTVIPIGIVVSGTAKAVAVRRHVPLVVGLSSVATENLFYSMTTSMLLILGALTFVRTFDIDPGVAIGIDILIGSMIAMLIFLILMVIRQWHFASELCEWLYRKGILKGILESGRLQVRLFENLVYGFYRHHPKRFIPIILIECSFHLLGILEVWFVLSRITESGATFLNAFLLESVNRLISIVFKLIPFLLGVDEAGAQMVAETLAIGAGVGVTLAIIRKGRMLFWAMIGFMLILKRGLKFSRLLGQ
ncbi:MAG: flippase-like domain-containing protein [Acidobacteria bacterium]|nr:flippase-like domain-containing protein [Acidobacteriota bacterium]